MRALLTFATVLALPIPTCYAVTIDGRLDPDEWRDAQRITDFRLTQPLSRLPAPQPTEAWVLSTPHGLAVGFRNLQAASVPRTRQRTQRDNSEAAVDRVNVYVDFDGDGRGGYNFTLTLADGIVDTTISNENQFNDDWDGDWHHAVSEDDAGWSAELLIPWHIAPMRDGHDGKRKLGIALDRVIGATGERASWPAVSLTETRFLSVLNKIEVPDHRQSLLTITPYINGIGDFVGHDTDFDAGADLFWKPNGRFQLSATLNPDFGQVESDRLVVNFGAVETFFDDKRPFFTENQSFFEVPFGSLSPNNRLIYTRRVGGLTDDGIGSGDVTAAVKLNGSAGGVSYGVFAASEGDAVGRDFYAVRASRDFALHGLGAMVTRVNRPYLDREATVYELDHRWIPNEHWALRSTVVGSSVDQRGRRVRDTGAQVRLDYDPGNGWRHQLYALHLGGNLQLNDFGYLERNNYNYLRYDLGRRVTALPEDSPFTAHDWHYSLSHRVNDNGVHIADAIAVNRRSERRDGGNQFFEVGTLSPGHDDLITRGNGVVDMPRRLFGVFERFRPRQGDSPWAFNVELQYDADGLSGWNRGLRSVYVEPSYHINDRLSLFSGLRLEHHPDWTLWQRDVQLLGTYRSNQIMLNTGAAWLINDRQELRVRLEAIGLDAEARKTWRVAADGEPVAVDTRLADFALRNLGFQIRYRYELAPLSYLYIAYVRGGSMLENGTDFEPRRQFRDAFELRDSEQLLVKLSYRFSL